MPVWRDFGRLGRFSPFEGKPRVFKISILGPPHFANEQGFGLFNFRSSQIASDGK